MCNSVLLQAKHLSLKLLKFLYDLLLCILRNENDPTTKLLNKLKVDYDGVKDQFKYMISRKVVSEISPSEKAAYFGPINYITHHKV